MDIGIDLGTTYSVIAVNGMVKKRGNYPESQYLGEYDVSLIPCPQGEVVIPSAFWCDPDDPSRVVVGREAKALANNGETPILFSKRMIGTTTLLRIGKNEFTAKQVATHILRYLKRCAEDALGTAVSRAVITHPAYFSQNQIEETRLAAIDAGFDMSDGEQMLMEPVAAALAYITADPRENVTVMTYDLGGGTFDVSVLERRDGLITMKSFDGNPLLGGYNFDRRLANWIIERTRKLLEGSGRSIIFEENAPSSSWSRLLQLAEYIKEKLSEQPTAKFPYPIKAPDILQDTSGQDVVISDRINREQYAALIQDLLDDSVDKARNALRKAGIKPQNLDVIVLAGGSSYGKWVEKTVKEAFPETMVVLESGPDSCVAVGAAIVAKELAPSLTPSGAEFEILADIPRVWGWPTVTIAGTVRRAGGDPLEGSVRGGLAAILQTPEAGEIGPVPLNDESVFIFQDVELLMGEPTRLRVTIIDREGRELTAQHLSIEYTDSDRVIPPMRVVPKPVYLRTASGLITIANEAEPLPIKPREIRLEKIHDDSTIALDIMQGIDCVTTIKIQDIPADAGSGSAVCLKIGIDRYNTMRGTATIRRKDGTMATEWPVEISFPPIEIPSLPELENTFRRLEAKREQEIHNGGPVRRTMLGIKGEALAKRIRSLLEEELIELQEVDQAIKELTALLNPNQDQLQPPQNDFDKLAENCLTAISETDSTDKQRYMSDLENIMVRGSDARLMRDLRKWRLAFHQLEGLYSRVTEPPPPPPEELPDTPDLKDMFHSQVIEELSTALEQMRQLVASKPDFKAVYLPRCEDVERDINDMRKRIEAIDDSLKPESALFKLQMIGKSKPKLKKKIGEIKDDLRKGGM